MATLLSLCLALLSALFQRVLSVERVGHGNGLIDLVKDIVVGHGCPRNL
jgi:hypothetical protein